MANLNMAEVERRLLDNGTVVPRDPTVTFGHELRRANDVTRLKYDTQYNAVTKPHVAFLESLGRIELQELLHKFIRDHPVLASETVSSHKRPSPSDIPPEQEPLSSRKQSCAHPRQQTPPPRQRRVDDDHNVLRTPQRRGSQPSVHHGRLQAVAVAQPSISQPHVNVVQMQQNPQPAPPRQMPLHERAVGHHRERERRTPRHHRDVSPSEIDGVKRIPGDLVDAINQMREPGEYFAKSQSRYLGPFEAYPTNADLPADDEYIILQRIARLPVTRKSVFQQVGSIIT